MTIGEFCELSEEEVRHRCSMGWVQPKEIAEALHDIDVETGMENYITAAEWWLNHCTSVKNYLDIIHERDNLLIEIRGLECRLARLEQQTGGR